MKERGEIQEPQFWTRSDRGRKCKQQTTADQDGEQAGGSNARPFNKKSWKRQKGAICPNGDKSSDDGSDQDWSDSDED